MKNNKVFFSALAILASTSVLAEEVTSANSDAEITTQMEPIQILAKSVDEYAVSNASTAMKTDTPIIDTPFSIQVVSEDVMQDQQAYRLEDVIKNVSNTQSLPSIYSSAYENIQSRGFKSEPFRDGKRIMWLTLPIANAERVEVLKGSAAIQYGRVEPGGMINVISKKPSATPYYAIEQQVGSNSFYRTTADLTGPINEANTLMYRINAEYLNTDSFVDEVFDKRTYFAPSLTWQPSTGTSLTFAYEYRRENELGSVGIPAIGDRPASLPRSRFLSEPDLNNKFTANVFSLTGEHAMNDQWTMRGGLASYRGNYKYASFVFNDLDSDGATLHRYGLSSDYDHRNTQDANIDLEGKFDTASIKHAVLIGTDYHRYRNYSNWADWNDVPIDIFNPVYRTVSAAALKASAPTSFNERTDIWNGYYFQDQLTIADHWLVLLGGRYDETRMSSGYAGIFGTGSSQADAKANVVTKREHQFSPKLGLTYKVAPWLSVYGSYTEAFGGNASTGITATGNMLKPESSEQYEIGAKTELFDGKMNASLAIYDLTKQNIATADLANPGFSRSIGEAKSKGVELDVSGEITPNLSVIANYAYNDISITKSNNGDEGNRFANVPRNSGAVWLKYAFKDDILNGLSIGGGIFAADQAQGDNANTFKLPGYARLDAFAAYKLKLGDHKVTAQLNINNLLDKKYYVADPSQGRASVFQAEPLKATASVKFEF